MGCAAQIAPIAFGLDRAEWEIRAPRPAGGWMPGQASHDKLALLWQFWLCGFCEEHLTVRASQGWRLFEEIEDRLPDGRHARLWRRSCDSFFSVSLL